MDDETMEAVGRAISFLGERALCASAADLVEQARNVALAAEDADADHSAATTIMREENEGRIQAISSLSGAATELEQVSSSGRKLAVSNLLGAATTLEAVLGVGLRKLGDTVADLARQCAEFQEAAIMMEKVRPTATGLQRQQNRSAPRWLFWRRWGQHIEDVEARGVCDRLLAAESTPTSLQASEIMDAMRTAVDFLHNEAARRTVHLVALADNVALSARNLAVLDRNLVEARDALQRADSPSSLKDAVNGLEAAAMDVQKEASAQRIILQSPVVQLAAACQGYLVASDAMAVVQRAATKRACAQETALVAVQNAQQLPPQPVHGPGQGDERRSVWLGYALFGSLALAPYLMATNAKPPKPLEYNDRLSISFVLSFWWSIVASGAACSSYARSWIEVFYAQLAARVGLYGTNIFAIYFFYWILGIGDTDSRCNCLWFATVMHFLFLAVACWRRNH